MKLKIFYFIIASILYIAPSLASEDSQYYLILAPSANAPYHKILDKVPAENRALIINTNGLTETQIEDLSKCHGIVQPLKNYSSCELESIALDLAQSSSIKAIIAPAEHDILRAARLRDYCNIPGQSYNNALAFRDKVIMKTILAESGIRVPAYRKINNLVDILEFISGNTFPVVIKPTRGSSSKETFKCCNMEDIQDFCKSSELNSDHISNYEVEEFIDGQMYHVDGLVVDGELKLSWVSRYKGFYLDAVEKGKIVGSCLLDKDNDLLIKLRHFTSSVLTALSMPANSAFHLEAFIRDFDQEAVLCEIACRVGGAGIREDFLTAFNGIDLGSAHIQMLAGILSPDIFENIPSEPTIGTGWIELPLRKKNLKAYPSSCPFSWIKRYSVHEDHSLYGSLISAFFLVESEADFENKYVLLAEWLEKNIELL